MSNLTLTEPPTVKAGMLIRKLEWGGFNGDADSVVARALDSSGGFTTVLDGAKAWLEHGINLNLILDKFPKAPQ